MSRHLPDCAGDDYCEGYCLHDGIPQPAILMRASNISCDCNWRQLHHDPDCPDSPEFWRLIKTTKFNPFYYSPDEYFHRIYNTWNCIKHGLIGSINGPVHYEVCDR